MMKKALPWIGAVLLLGALAYLTFSKKGKEFDGRITLNKNDKIPYGTYVAFDLLKNVFPKAKVEVNKTSPSSWKEDSLNLPGQVLIIIDNYFNPDEDELDKITAFAQHGNDVYISAIQMNYDANRFFKTSQPDFYTSYYDQLQEDNGIKVDDSFFIKLDTAVFHKPWQFSFPGASYANYFDTINKLFTYPIGKASIDTPNLAGIHTKYGSIYLHTAPIAFTNFFLLYNQNHHYLENLFSLSSADTRKVIWDEYFIHKPISTYNRQEPGILDVILKYPNFKSAFWLALILLALYIITEAKRRQRIIPPYAKPANESLEFVKTVGKLYFEKGDHKNLAEKLTQYFLDYVRTKYKVPTSQINPAFVKTLSQKTNIPETDITEITDCIHTINLNNNITSEQLIKYHSLLENFYKKA